MKNKPTVIVILGATSTGKSDFAVGLARKLQQESITAEIISADSRQVYKGLNLLSGKITEKEMHGIRHHMLDVVSPKKTYTVSDYVTRAKKVVDGIIKRGNLPIVVGGTGFYIDALVNGIVLPEVPPNIALRKKLEQKTVEELFIMLKKKDSARAKTIDPHNKVRLIRALEITEALGKVPKQKSKSEYNTLKLGLTVSDEVLRQRIKTRLEKRVKQGMLREAQKLHENGLSYERMESLGLECKYAALYLQKKITKKELLEQLETAIWQYARRQKMWFKRDKSIEWINSN
jgi:tRNA dimethylallyltransferase